MTIKDLAKLCGVSVSTVSRALNGHPDVSEDVRQRVMDAAQTYHYIPNDAARDLVGRRTDTIGLVVRGRGNLFFTSVIHAIERAAERRGFTVVLHFISSEDDELQAAAQLAQSKRPVGLILLGGESDYDPAKTAKLSVPFVCCSFANQFGSLDPERFGSVTIDDELEAYRAVKYLLMKGHRRIAMLLNDPCDHSIGMLRHAGYTRALLEAEIEPDPALLLRTGGFALPDAYRAVARALTEGVDFTALFALSDSMAVAAMRALHDNERRVPEDCSVIAIDGLALTEYTVPTLTTMAQPKEDLGATAVQLLSEMIDGGAGRHLFVNAALRTGESVMAHP